MERNISYQGGAYVSDRLQAIQDAFHAANAETKKRPSQTQLARALRKFYNGDFILPKVEANINRCVGRMNNCRACLIADNQFPGRHVGIAMASVPMQIVPVHVAMPLELKRLEAIIYDLIAYNEMVKQMVLSRCAS